MMHNQIKAIDYICLSQIIRLIIIIDLISELSTEMYEILDG